MGQEIERKFLVDKNKWLLAEKPPGERYRQGYLLTDPYKTIRVRLTETAGFITIKGITVSATRSEYEYGIPKEEANELLDQFAISELSKIRYKVAYADKVWEIDEFLGDNLGLIIAEIELGSEEERFELPPWIGMEVTGEEKYYNSNLTIEPYVKWRK